MVESLTRLSFSQDHFYIQYCSLSNNFQIKSSKKSQSINSKLQGAISTVRSCYLKGANVLWQTSSTDKQSPERHGMIHPLKQRRETDC